jgi:hypothetical protein
MAATTETEIQPERPGIPRSSFMAASDTYWCFGVKIVHPLFIFFMFSCCEYQADTSKTICLLFLREIGSIKFS